MRNTDGATWRHWLVIPALLTAVTIAASEAVQLRRAGDEPIQDLNRLASAQPWGGLAAREASLRLPNHWLETPSERLQALDWALRRYPLDAEAWMLRARLLRELQGLDEATRRSLSAALAAQPGSRELNWRALTLAEAFGDRDLIAQALRQWTLGRTQNVDQALFAAARWFPEPGERLDRVLPDGEGYLVRALRYANDQGLPELAEAAWQRLEQPRRADERALIDYLQVQRAHGHRDRVLAVLQTLDPAYRPGRLPAGDFSVSLAAMERLGWALRMPTGAQLVRDERDLPPELPAVHPAAPLPAGSLRLEFSGTDNIRLNAPRVRFRPVEPGRYELRGWWKAERLTTRALPALEVRLDGTRVRHRVDVPAPSFEWQPFSVALEIDDTLPVIQFSVVRESTQAFDRYLGGRLSLAALSLEPAGERVPESVR